MTYIRTEPEIPDYRAVKHFFESRQKVQAKNVDLAMDLYFRINEKNGETSCEALSEAALMCRYLDPDAEELIPLILFRHYLGNKLTGDEFRKYFGQKRYDRYFCRMERFCKEAPDIEGNSRTESIRYYIMTCACDRMFRHLMRKLGSDRNPDTARVLAAYKLAGEKHYGACFTANIPWLAHTVRTAEIMYRHKYDCQVIAAALLHDVMTVDKGCTEETVAEICGKKISNYVSSISELDAIYSAACAGSDGNRFGKTPDESRLNTILRKFDANPDIKPAVCIKAAECIDTLRVSGTMDLYNRCDYTPLFRALGMKPFLRELDDSLWGAADPERFSVINLNYTEMLSLDAEGIEAFGRILKTNTEPGVNSFSGLPGRRVYSVEITKRTLLASEIYKLLKEKGWGPSEYGDKTRKGFIPLCDYDIIAAPQESGADLSSFVKSFAHMFEEKIARRGYVITDFYPSSENSFFFEAEDSYNNIFRCRLIMRADYEAENLELCVCRAEDYGEEDENTEDTIRVIKPDGNILTLPIGSTVIDAAFSIHEEIGLTLKSAVVNNNAVSVYQTLIDGDRIVIYADTERKDGETVKFECHARINWLNFVKTKKARKKLISYLSDKYEGDNPKYENEAETAAVERTADRILGELKFPD